MLARERGLDHHLVESLPGEDATTAVHELARREVAESGRDPVELHDGGATSAVANHHGAHGLIPAHHEEGGTILTRCCSGRECRLRARNVARVHGDHALEVGVAGGNLHDVVGRFVVRLAVEPDQPVHVDD